MTTGIVLLATFSPIWIQLLVNGAKWPSGRITVVKRRGEIWIGRVGFFYHKLYGVETPRFSLYGPSPKFKRELERIRMGR